MHKLIYKVVIEMTKNTKKTKERPELGQSQTNSDKKSYCGCGCVPPADEK